MENKRRFINKKLATGILASSLILGACGCTKTNQDKPAETVIVYETVVVTATPAPTNTNAPANTNTPVPTDTSVPTNTPVPTEETDITWETNEYGHEVGGLDAHLDDWFNKINDINKKIDDIDFNKIKDSTINYAKDLIDFIFYGGEMNGMTFDELKDDAKEEVYAELQRVDSFIMEFVPDYKERIGEKYNLVKDFASTKLSEAKEIFNSHIDIEVNINVEKGKSLILSNKKTSK